MSNVIKVNFKDGRLKNYDQKPPMGSYAKFLLFITLLFVIILIIK